MLHQLPTYRASSLAWESDVVVTSEWYGSVYALLWVVQAAAADNERRLGDARHGLVNSFPFNHLELGDSANLRYKTPVVFP